MASKKAVPANRFKWNSSELWYEDLTANMALCRDSQSTEKTKKNFDSLQKAISFALKEGYDINFVSSYRASNAGNTLLQCALIHNCPLEIITFLLEHGADVAYKNAYGDNALSLAIGHHTSEQILKEVAIRSDINSTDRLGRTTISKWCEIYILYGRRFGSGRKTGDMTELRYLLQLGADPEKDTYWKRKVYNLQQIERQHELEKFIAVTTQQLRALANPEREACFDYEL